MGSKRHRSPWRKSYCQAIPVRWPRSSSTRLLLHSRAPVRSKPPFALPARTGITSFGWGGSKAVAIVDTAQLIDCWQSPVGISRQAQVLAVLHCLSPCDVIAVVLRGPHESGRRVDPIPACLRLLCTDTVIVRGLSAANHGDDREKNQDSFCVLLHRAHSQK